MEYRQQNSHESTIEGQSHAGDHAHDTVNNDHEQHDEDNADQAGHQAGLQGTLTQSSAYALQLDTFQLKGKLTCGNQVRKIGCVLRSGIISHGDDS